ncbi:MAG: hypothetical protein ACREI3_01770 [Nitrospirales bacterium]
MHGWSGASSSVSSLPAWSLLFAREPEPDLELDENLDDLETQTGGRGGWQGNQRKKSSGPNRPLLLMLLLVVVAGAYLAISPGTVLDMLGLGEPDVIIPDVPSPTASKPKPTTPPTPAPAGSAATIPGQPGVAPAAVPVPAFNEGQMVLVKIDPTKPITSIALYADESVTKPGPTLPPGTTLTVVDGRLMNNAWVYIVKSDKGMTGWIPEAKLKAKS